MSSNLGDGHNDRKEYKYVIVPVATIGCGKTTISLVLANLLGWGHVQNDNITRPKKGGTGRKLCEEVKKTLQNRVVSIVDRNNHQRRERSQIFADMTDLMPNEDLRFVALHFVHNGKEGKRHIWNITYARVMARGNNHQSIQAASDSEMHITQIMRGFLARFQPVNMSEPPDKDIFDYVIDIEVDTPIKFNVKQIISKFIERYPGVISEMPTDEAIDEAVEQALAYVPDTKKNFGSSR